MTDLIGRQIVEVTLHGTEADGLDLQRRLRRICADAVTPSLERTLALLGPPEGRLVIDRLEIDLGTLSWDGLARELPEAVAREVTTFLSRPAAPPEPFGEPAADIRHRTERQAVAEALLTFLRTGRLPWSYRVPAGRHLSDEVLAAWAPDAGGAPSAAFRAELAGILAAETPRRRLLRQFPPSFHRTLLRELSAATAATMDRCLDITGVGADRPTSATAVSPPAAADLLREALWEAAFAGLTAAVPPGPAQLLATAWRSVPVDAPGRTDLLSAIEATENIDLAAGPVPAPVITPGTTTPKNTASGTTASGRPASGGAQEDGEYVVNAGVVVLHPFLPRFFETLGVADGDRLLQPDRALCLLHHLATGETSAPEYDLSMAKVLCEVPSDEPVTVLELGAHDLAEADLLLRSAIGHWDVLRGTGPDGLRGTFLTRAGSLHDRLLRIETESFDVLLDQLPWGLSMIQLPWMSRLLLVEWR
ncbi:contractile injection system tape measure protein [Actinoplanes sp. NPDC026670]|uniref:contractile injection system tape measure protein n=1 Tax=Actinoplanes sp. NPDC026670 TaxID=3154700 RepID=UPI0033C18A55